MQPRLARGVGTPDEQRLAGRVAGVLYLAGAATALLLMLLPAVSTRHLLVVCACSAVGAAWGLACLFLIDFGRASKAVFLLPALLALVLTATVVASSGGAHSPARLLLLFGVAYAACFYEPRDAAALISLAVVVNAAPVLYDTAGVDDFYLGELVVISLGYLALGAMIATGKQLLVSARGEAEDLALHDPLTGLANRRAMIQWLEGRLAGRDGSELGLILVDLDGFKDVNTLHGYQAGDRVLCETARALESAVRAGDLVARLGGDEFAVLVPGTAMDDVGAVGTKVIEAVREVNTRVDLPGVLITASIGWVAYPRDADTLDDLVKIADSSLRQAKASGKDRGIGPLSLPAA